MLGKSKWLAVVCVAALLVFVPGCDDDDDVIERQEVSSGQAEAVIGGLVVPGIETLMSVAEVLSNLAVKSAQTECVPIPGIEADFFCTPPDSGELCEVDETHTDVVFENCLSEEGDDIDGTVSVTAGLGMFNVTFNNLNINGQVFGGQASFMYTECDDITVTNFTISDGATVDMNGSFSICDGVPSGSANGIVTGSSFLPWTLQINIDEGIATMTVIDNETQTPLYACTFNPITEVVDCFDITEPF